MHPVISTDGVLIKNKELILAKWDDYQLNLLYRVHPTDPGFLVDLPTLPIIPKLDDPPPFDEVEKTILCLKDNKTTGAGKIPAEVIKYGGCALHRRLHNLILTAGPLCVSHSNGKMPTLFLYTSKRVTSIMWQQSRHLLSLCSRQSAG